MDRTLGCLHPVNPYYTHSPPPPQAYAQQVLPHNQLLAASWSSYRPLPSQAVEKTLAAPAKVRPQVLKYTCMPLMVGPALSSISPTTPPPPYHTEEFEPPNPPQAQHHLSLSTLRPCPHCH